MPYMCSGTRAVQRDAGESTVTQLSVWLGTATILPCYYVWLGTATGTGTTGIGDTHAHIGGNTQLV